MEEAKPEKLFYTIGEVSKLLGETVPTLRYWTEQFPMLKPRTNKKGNRLFTPEDIELLKRIQFLLREKKMKIKGARESLKLKPDGVARNTELLERLNQVKSTLLSLQQILQEKSKEQSSKTSELKKN